MSKLKLAGGSSSTNSVSFFLSKNGKGIEAIRQKNGTIVTKELDSFKKRKLVSKILHYIFIFSLYKVFVYHLNLPIWLYHIPTFILGGLLLIAILCYTFSPEMRMYHGAEHKVSHWYSENGINNLEYNLKSIKKCSRIHSHCGTNLFTTIVTFQLISSICLEFFSFHIPEFIPLTLPLYVFKLFPFNALGMLVQLFTTATPTSKHIYVAFCALSTLITNENKESE